MSLLKSPANPSGFAYATAGLFFLVLGALPVVVAELASAPGVIIRAAYAFLGYNATGIIHLALSYRKQSRAMEREPLFGGGD